MSTGAAAGAAARRAERRMIEHLREAGAVSSSSATSIPNQRWIGKRVLARLVAAGAVREANPGYYLDEAAYDVYHARRTRNMIIAVGTAAAIAAFVIWLASHQ